MSLKKLKNSLLSLDEISQANPLKYWRGTKPQNEFLKDPARIKLLRGGNQIGKSTAGIVELVGRLLGEHPFLDVPQPPIEGWLIAHSWEQSKSLMGKLNELIPPHELHPSVEFVPGKGYRGTGAPVIRFNNGSILRVKTTQQARGGQTLSLASGTVDAIWVDEPPPHAVFGEIWARLTRTRGFCCITMTPIGVPCDWLRKMVETGQVSETVAPLNESNMTPEFPGAVPLLSQKEIDNLAANYLSIDRDSRIRGDWDSGIPMEGRIFDQFSEEHVSDQACSIKGDYRFGIGIDHGSDAGSQVAILVAVDISDPKDVFVYVLDEYIAGAETAEVHARGIMRMIERNNLSINQITRWTGDRAHGGTRFGGKMSNKILMSGFAHVLGYPNGKLPFYIRTAFKPRFSVYYTCQAIHERMVKKQFQIFPKCKTLIKSLKHWALKSNGGLDTMSEHKHTIDGMRYAIMPLIDQAYKLPSASKIQLRR